VRSVKNEREVALSRCHEPRVEECELLVQQFGLRCDVVRESAGRRRESLEDRLGSDLGDVVEHLPKLGFGIQLSRANGQAYGTFSERSPHGDPDSPDMLLRLEPPGRLRFVVEAEELACRIQRNVLGAIDPEDVRAVFLESDQLAIALDAQRRVRKRADRERAEGITPVISDWGLDARHVTR
jgi:hypothetical protein